MALNFGHFTYFIFIFKVFIVDDRPFSLDRSPLSFAINDVGSRTPPLLRFLILGVILVKQREIKS